MLQRSIGFLFAATMAVVPFTSNAHAQEKWPEGGGPFGARAANVVTIDEFAGFYRESIYSPDAADTSDSGLLRFGSSGGISALNETTRVGYHRFVTPEISVGSGFHFTSRDESFGALIVAEQAKVTTLGISPRVGFVFSGSDSGAFWLRVGFQYYHYGFDNDSSAWDFGPGLELFYVITPFEHFGITLGPVVELQLAGNLHQQSGGVLGGPVVTRDTALRRRTFGFALGFLFDL